ncbi:MAG: response regulator [Gammaproteobacteria bacterium]|nr:response regulator [Gammaproteobacteria bacterium]
MCSSSSYKGTLLIVDDVPTNLKVLLNYLGGFNFKLLVAQDGEDALAKVTAGKPDLILMDVMMPGMNGFEACRRLQADEKTSDIPVIFMSALSDTVDKVKGFKIGGVDYITKPVQQEEVLARITAHLTLRKLQKQVRDQNVILEERVRKRTKALNDTRLQVVRSLGKAAEYRDNETGMHVIRVSNYAELLGKCVGMSEEHCEILLHASPMHDVGKIGIPDRILLKPGKLDADEWTLMKTHTIIGEKILSGYDSELLMTAAVIAKSHHEKWDGSGYPDGLKGEEISLESRIICICDVFDALTSKRPYKGSWPVEKAAAYIEQKSGKSFDPNLVQVFKEALNNIFAIRDQYPDE